jgi:hypothetical protein
MNYLKNLALLVFTVFSTTFLIAQNKYSDQLVAEFLGSSKYENSLTNNPGLIEYLKIKSTQGYSIETVSPEKIIGIEPLPTVFYMKNKISASQFATDVLTLNFNFLKYSFPTIEKGVFLLNPENNTVIVIYSNQQINSKMRNN